MKRALVAGSITATVITAFASVPAWADPDADQFFLQAVHSRHIGADGGDAGMIESAHGFCNMLADGDSLESVVAQSELYKGRNLTDDDVRFLVRTSAAAYCPQYIR